MKTKPGGSGSSLPRYPDLEGKVVLITGGSSGIGLACARSFARQGARVIIASRNEGRAKAALKDLAKTGDVQWHPADVTNGKSVARLIDDVMTTHGRLDCAFNNGASGGRLAPVAAMSEATWRATIDGYLTSVFLCMNAEIAAMRRSRAGVIVNNASVDGLRGYPLTGGAAYSAAKHGLVGLTRSAALEHAANGPRIALSVRAGSIRHPWVSGSNGTKKSALLYLNRHRAAGLVIRRKSQRPCYGFAVTPHRSRLERS